jgi:hypothetical protein
VSGDPSRGAPRAPRFVAVAGVASAILTLYFIEAWLRKTPWVFTDELEWTQISRSIATTGHAARRGEAVNFKSLYPYVLAPWWWIHSTAAAYAAIKYANAVLMALAAVPTYLLARMVISQRAAAMVAALSVLIPGMSYASSLIPEVLAYPWYALCSWLIVRALTRRRPGAIALAAAASIVAILVRAPQFLTVGASFAIAAAGLWVTGPRGRAFRAGWSRGDTFGAIVLLVGGLILFNRVFLQHIHEWQVTTEFWKGRMVDLGLKAALALAVGLGILPVLGAFAALRLPDRRGNPAYRAFAAYLASAIFCISLYTAVKATALSLVFSTLTEERNMIYLSPLFLIGTALVFEARRVDWRIVAAASAFVLFLIWAKPPNLLFPYFEAPGFAILDVVNRHLHWNVTDLRIALVVVLGLSLLVLRFRHVRGVAAVMVAVSGAWMLTSEIAVTAGTVDFANRFRSQLPAHLDWVDRATHGQGVTYVGQELPDPNGVWLTEFWNRDLKHVDLLNGGGPGPGPSYAPQLVRADGLLSGLGGIPYVLADSGVTLQGKPVTHWKQLVLYKRSGPWRLLDENQQVYSDTWAPGWSTYTYFRPGQRGTLVLWIGRQGYTGDAAPGRAFLAVGTVKVSNGAPVLGRVYASRRTLVRNGSVQVIRFHVPRTPVRLVLSIPNTFRASAADPRQLGAQVTFSFVPASKRG